MASTPNLDLTLVAAAQAQKHVTVNEALRALDAVVHLSVIDRDLTTPPGSPTDGDRYIVGTSSTGDWSGEDGNIAVYESTAWVFYTPSDGWTCWVEDEQITLLYNSQWGVHSASPGSNGESVAIKRVTEHLTSLSGATVSTSAQFPAECIILGASVRVTTTVTGATNFDVGDGSTANRFGNNVALTAGTTDVGSVNAAYNGSAAPVVLTAGGSNFTGGDVRVMLAYIELTPPTS